MYMLGLGDHRYTHTGVVHSHLAFMWPLLHEASLEVDENAQVACDLVLLDEDDDADKEPIDGDIMVEEACLLEDDPAPKRARSTKEALVSNVDDYRMRPKGLEYVSPFLYSMFPMKQKKDTYYKAQQATQNENGTEGGDVDGDASGRPHASRAIERLSLPDEHPQSSTHVVRRMRMYRLPYFIRDPPLRPAMESDAVKDKETYAAFFIGNFVPDTIYRHVMMTKEGAATMCLWDLMLVLQSMSETTWPGRDVAMHLALNVDWRAQTRSRSRDHVVLVKSRMEAEQGGGEDGCTDAFKVEGHMHSAEHDDGDAVEEVIESMYMNEPGEATPGADVNGELLARLGLVGGIENSVADRYVQDVRDLFDVHEHLPLMSCIPPAVGVAVRWNGDVSKMMNDANKALRANDANPRAVVRPEIAQDLHPSFEPTWDPTWCLCSPIL